MSNELIKQSDQAITQQTIEDFLFSTGTRLNPQQKAMFIKLAMTFNLNPFKREIYCVPFGNSFNYVTGYQVYISRAERTGKLDGWQVETIREEGQLKGAKVTIHRKDWEHPFEWTVSLSEFARTNNSWKTMPEFMIKKVSIAQAFRLCFPDEFSGMPYIQEEIDASEPIEVTPVEIKQNPAESVEVTTEPNSDAEIKLKEAKSLEELKEIWQSLSPQDQKKLKPIKDAMKQKLESEVSL
jgi:phage recombination protein Bet